jgi:hypothetical protein
MAERRTQPQVPVSSSARCPAAGVLHQPAQEINFVVNGTRRHRLLHVTDMFTPLLLILSQIGIADNGAAVEERSRIMKV